MGIFSLLFVIIVISFGQMGFAQGVDSLTFVRAKVITSISAAAATPDKAIRLRLSGLDSAALCALPLLSRLQELTLVNYRGQGLPPALCNQPFLQTIFIESDVLKTLPDELVRLKQLRGLYLTTPRLERLPYSFYEAPRLSLVALRNARALHWRSAFAALEKLASLRTLEIADGGPAVFPMEIGRLTQLQELFIFSDQLETLPPEIGNLKALRRLFISNVEVGGKPNPLRSFPVEIAQLKSLTALTLSATPHVDMAALCAALMQSTTLKSLDLSFNELRTLPPDFARLKSVETVSLAGNPLIDFPQELLRLYRLRWLDLRATPLTDVPEEIAALSELRRLWAPIHFTGLKDAKRFLPNCKIELN